MLKAKSRLQEVASKRIMNSILIESINCSSRPIHHLSSNVFIHLHLINHSHVLHSFHFIYLYFSSIHLPFRFFNHLVSTFINHSNIIHPHLHSFNFHPRFFYPPCIHFPFIIIIPYHFHSSNMHLSFIDFSSMLFTCSPINYYTIHTHVLT